MTTHEIGTLSSVATVVFVTILGVIQTQCRHNPWLKHQQTFIVSILQSYFKLYWPFCKVPIEFESNTTINPVPNNCFRTCTKCRKSYPSSLFANSNDSSLLSTCNNCRTRLHALRFPTAFEPTPIQHNENLGRILNHHFIGKLIIFLE